MKMKKSVIRLIGVLAVLSMVIAMFASCGGGKAITVVGREDGSGTKSAFMEIIGLKGKADVEGIIAHSSTAAATAAFRDSQCSRMGIRTVRVQIPRSPGDNPRPSLPMARAQRL